MPNAHTSLKQNLQTNRIILVIRLKTPVSVVSFCASLLEDSTKYSLKAHTLQRTEQVHHFQTSIYTIPFNWLSVEFLRRPRPTFQARNQYREKKKKLRGLHPFGCDKGHPKTVNKNQAVPQMTHMYRLMVTDWSVHGMTSQWVWAVWKRVRGMGHPMGNVLIFYTSIND